MKYTHKQSEKITKPNKHEIPPAFKLRSSRLIPGFTRCIIRKKNSYRTAGNKLFTEINLHARLILVAAFQKITAIPTTVQCGSQCHFIMRYWVSESCLSCRSVHGRLLPSDIVLSNGRFTLHCSHSQAPLPISVLAQSGITCSQQLPDTGQSLCPELAVRRLSKSQSYHTLNDRTGLIADIILTTLAD